MSNFIKTKLILNNILSIALKHTDRPFTFPLNLIFVHQGPKESIILIESSRPLKTRIVWCWRGKDDKRLSRFGMEISTASLLASDTDIFIIGIDRVCPKRRTSYHILDKKKDGLEFKGWWSLIGNYPFCFLSNWLRSQCKYVTYEEA